jgi:catechol 2,3-dioxygenase-like lactoylglutathione lyase family enzyme
MAFKLKKIREIVVITANLKEMIQTFCDYGGWKRLFTKNLPPSVSEAWQLPKTASGRETLLQFMDVPHGRLRFVELKGIPQKQMRPTSKIWDTGGILDIDIRVNDIQQVFDDMTDRGWSGAAEPMFLPVTDFVLEEALITNADSMMIALAKRLVPPIEIPKDKNLASHVYLSAMTVKNLAESTDFFVNKLGFQLANDRLVVKFPPKSPNNFGMPHNFGDYYEYILSIYSPDGTRDSMCECIEARGLVGHDYAARCQPPNRGILCYRIEVEGIKSYLEYVNINGVAEITPLSIQAWHGFGTVRCFTVSSPDGARIEFFERV